MKKKISPIPLIVLVLLVGAGAFAAYKWAHADDDAWKNNIQQQHDAAQEMQRQGAADLEKALGEQEALRPGASAEQRKQGDAIRAQGQKALKDYQKSDAAKH